MSGPQVVICGAGIAGVSTAYHLSVGHGLSEVTLVDERPPLSLTSDKSTECYRNWWPGPGPAMVALMNRSIDILEQLAEAHGNPFNLNRRGYLFATADPARVADFEAQGHEAAELGAGELRIHRGQASAPPYQPSPPFGYAGLPDGADLILDPQLIRTHFPYLTGATVAVLHARRAGWFSAQQCGQLLLAEARQRGVRLLRGRVEQVELDGGAVKAVQVSTDDGHRQLSADHFVNAAGPYFKQVAELVGIELPVFSELHAKVAYRDDLGAFPRQAPMLIWTDPQRLPWSPEERRSLQADPEASYLLDEFPQGAHGRPEGPLDSPIVLLIWTYDETRMEPRFPPEFDPHYPEIALRGIAAMLPEVARYFDSPPRPVIDGGYYTKTEENRPLIGPMGVSGAWMIGALSGYGLMASPAAGELLAAQIAGARAPDYAEWFRLDRYQDPEYQALLQDWGRSGQL